MIVFSISKSNKLFFYLYIVPCWVDRYFSKKKTVKSIHKSHVEFSKKKLKSGVFLHEICVICY